VCNLYSITTNQAAILALFRVVNRYVGNLPPMPGVFPDYPAPVVRNSGGQREMTMMRWACRRHHARAASRSPTSGTRRHHTGAAGSQSETRCRHLTFCASELLAGAASSDWPLR
jgi:putative SOS response-associated peptidase YedK